MQGRDLRREQKRAMGRVATLCPLKPELHAVVMNVDSVAEGSPMATKIHGDTLTRGIRPTDIPNRRKQGRGDFGT